MTNPRTRLDDAAATLDRHYEKMKTEDDPFRPGMGTPPSEMFAHDAADIIPLELYGESFSVLVYPDHSHHHSEMEVNSILYDTYERDGMPEIATPVRDTDYLTLKQIRAGEIGDEATDDTPHILATLLGYHTRYLLDGRDYDGWTTNHDAAPLSQ